MTITNKKKSAQTVDGEFIAAARAAGNVIFRTERGAHYLIRTDQDHAQWCYLMREESE